MLFRAWWQTNKQTNNRVNLEQVCSLNIKQSRLLQYLKDHKCLGLLLRVFSKCLCQCHCHCLFVGHVSSPLWSNVSKVKSPKDRSFKVFSNVFVFVFVVVFLLVRSRFRFGLHQQILSCTDAREMILGELHNIGFSLNEKKNKLPLPCHYLARSAPLKELHYQSRAMNLRNDYPHCCMLCIHFLHRNLLLITAEEF